MSQSSSVAASMGRPGAARASALVAVQRDARLAQRAEDVGEELLGLAGVDEQLLGGVARSGTLQLGVEDDRAGRVEIGAGVDVHVVVARGGVDHRDGGDALERRLQALAAARDDEVHDAGLGGQLGQLLAAAAGDQRHRARRQARGGGGVGGDGGEHRVGVRAELEPRSTTALPDFRHSAAASMVTLGRAS